jgi:hypothetical protein
MAYHNRRLRKVKPRVGRDGQGNKLEKRVLIKVIIGDIVTKHVMVAPAGKGYSEDDIWEIRAHAIDRLDTKFPMFEFNEVEVGRNQFNYIMCGTRGVLPQPELNNGTTEPDAESNSADHLEPGGSGESGAGSLREQIARALAGSGSRGGDHEGQPGDGDAIASGSGEDRSGATESADAAAATATENDSSSRADGISEQNNLQEQGPHDGGDSPAHIADRGSSDPIAGLGRTAASDQGEGVDPESEHHRDL